MPTVEHVETVIEDFVFEDGVIDPETGLLYIAYPEEGDFVPNNFNQFDLVVYLTQVLRWHYHEEKWLVMGDVCIRRTPHDEHSIFPDVGVHKVAVNRQTKPRGVGTWRMWEPNHPAPFVVFEVMSPDTWARDIGEKIERYHELGVNEYFAYDPAQPPHNRKAGGRRLYGWNYTTGLTKELPTDARGWMWSNELKSWLGPDEEYLRLYDETGKQRLTKAEAGWEAKHIAKQRAKEERVARRAAQLQVKTEHAAYLAEYKARTEAEQLAAAQSKARTEAEQLAAAEHATLEALRAKLREHNIDPDNL